jgi:DNA helicase II / ATP-dependent DNA helicase PcrA
VNPSEFPEEQAYLATTVQFLDAEIAKAGNRTVVMVPDRDAAREIWRILNQAAERYVNVRPRPYFGRVDFLRQDGTLVEAYIGTDHIPGYVYSWAAPFPGQLFYADASRVDGYNAPAGRVRGKITLQRQYTIENAELLDVAEVYRLAVSAGQTETSVDTVQEFMMEKLAGSRGAELKEVIATIRPDQYQQIAAASEQVMIVQGVAGSGKSIVGLHRIAFLLSPFNERSDRPTASRVFFFGPTRSFLRYVANLLPSLDVKDVNQRTVQDWLASTLSARVFLDRGEPLIERLLRHTGKRWQDAYDSAKLKGSLRMARVLERHVQSLRKQFISGATAFAVRFESATPIVIDVRNTRRALRALPTQPLNTQRKLAIERVINALWEVHESRSNWPSESLTRARSAFVERVTPEVEKQVTAFWPELDFRREYRGLLADSRGLASASNGTMGPHESSLLSASLPARPTVFEPEDLGALSYLDYLLNERPSSRFEHVVLDEAQEISPIELMVLKLHSRGSGFTILGDLTQSLAPQGIERWRDVLELFRGATLSRFEARSSYRSTYEITRYANRVLKAATPNGVTAVPYPRRGSRPTFVPSRNYDDMVEAIAQDIDTLTRADMGTVGVLCKSEADAKKLHRSLVKRGVRGVGLVVRQSTPTESVVVAPIYLTRGLEYDAVVLAGASKDHYPMTPLHNRLLYLGVSRAAHQLHIHWFGQPAAQLGVKRPGAREKSERKPKQGKSKPRTTVSVPNLVPEARASMPMAKAHASR